MLEGAYMPVVATGRGLKSELGAMVAMPGAFCGAYMPVVAYGTAMIGSFIGTAVAEAGA